jgi:hypothetical protein
MRWVSLPAVLVIFLLAVSGCGSGGGFSGAATTCRSGGSTTPVQTDVPRGTRYLTDVIVASTACTDRVEFAFERGVPGYRVAYENARQAQTEDASGRHIPVAGSAFIVVRLADAATARSDESGLSWTYSGRRRVPAHGARAVREVVKTGDFEGVVTWAIGLDARHPFTASATADAVVVEIG